MTKTHGFTATSITLAKDTARGSLLTLLVICSLIAACIPLCACAPIANPAIDQREYYTQRTPGETMDVEAFSTIDLQNEPILQAELLSYDVYSCLPDGYEKSDIYLYGPDQERYNKEYGLYTIDDAGNLSEGWSLVVAHIQYNNSDVDCRASLSNVFVAAFENGQVIENAPELDSWILNGIETKEDYYLPTIKKQSTSDYYVGIFIPTECLSADMILVMERKKNSADEFTYLAYYLGDLQSQKSDDHNQNV